MEIVKGEGRKKKTNKRLKQRKISKSCLFDSEIVVILKKALLMKAEKKKGVKKIKESE